MEVYHNKQMSEKKFFSNVAPSPGSGPLLLAVAVQAAGGRRWPQLNLKVYMLDFIPLGLTCYVSSKVYLSPNIYMGAWLYPPWLL